MAGVLGVTGPGKRYWFCFAGGDEPVLRLQPVSQDPSGERFQAWLRSRRPQLGKPMAMGAAVVAEDGAFGFASPVSFPGFISTLAGWCVAQRVLSPQLARLAGASYAQTGEDGEVLDMQLDDAAWAPLDRYATTELARVLKEAAVGDRMWALLSPERLEPPLVLIPIRDDPGGDRLQLLAGSLGSADAPLRAGVASLLPGRKLVIATEGADRAALKHLAGWVQARVDEHPELAALQGCRMDALDADQKVTAQLAHKGLWRGVPDRNAGRLVGALAAILDDIEPGEQHWFWACPADDILLMTPTAGDPDGNHLRRRVRWLGLAIGDGVTGVAIARRGGAVLFTLEEDPATLQALLLRLAKKHMAAFPPLRQLAFSRAVALPEPAEDIPSHFQPLADVLGTLKPGDKLWFWFARKVKGEHPNLVMRPADDFSSLGAFQTWTEDLPPARTITVGQARVGSGGGLTFRSGAPAPEFIQTLARWTAACFAQCPPLIHLKDARFVCKVGDTITDRQSAPEAWAALGGNT